MEFDYGLIGGMSAGGDSAVFEEKAREAKLGEFSGRGFLAVDPKDKFERRLGHVRIPFGQNAADAVARKLHAKEPTGEPARWPFRGTVYRPDGSVTEEELELHIQSFSFGDGLQIHVVEAPPRRP